ncbi:hypothetical protein PINS_up001312 [Pythium insidiosum]|nr:hypothetical protein PINS_up001312 [Pythium insidiosum]
MGADAGSSLLMHVGLMGVGFALGRLQVIPLVLQLVDELYALPVARKVSRERSERTRLFLGRH